MRRAPLNPEGAHCNHMLDGEHEKLAAYNKEDQ